MSVKLEQENRERLKQTEAEVRQTVVEDRKKELGRTLRDLDDMLQKLHAENQMRIKEYQILYTNESDMKAQLDDLQKEIEELLKIDPEKCPTDKMAEISSKIESTRRNILRIELSGAKDSQGGKVASTMDAASIFDLSALTTWQLIKCGLAFSFPLIITIFLAAVLIAGVTFTVFG